MTKIDPVTLTQDLIRCPSITPHDGGALAVLEQVLQPLGFVCHRLRFEEAGTAPIDNLYARLGTQAPHFCFAGHTDVVPVGQGWTTDPFAAEIKSGALHGRGAADMKGAIGAFVAAISNLIDQHGQPAGSISLLITGDEEGPAINGTKKMLAWCAERGETFDACVVGEPTNPERLGQMAKIGRRGSLNAIITVHGVQGHSAYPHLADNPIPRLIEILNALTAQPLDQGSAHFQPSSLVITTIDVGNTATNIIPAKAQAGLNIRFNDLHSGASLKAWIEQVAKAAGGRVEVAVSISGESFLTPPGPLSQAIEQAVYEVTGLKPELSTSGGTSDARFIKDYCPVVEFGLVGQTMHKADECARVEDIRALTAIYQKILENWFQGR